MPVLQVRRTLTTGTQDPCYRYTGPLLQIHRTLTTYTQDPYYRYTELLLQIRRTVSTGTQDLYFRYTGPLLQVHRTRTTNTQDPYYRYAGPLTTGTQNPYYRYTGPFVSQGIVTPSFSSNMFSELSAKSFMALAQADKARVDLLFMNKEGKVGLRRVSPSDPAVSFPFSIASELLLFNVHRNHKVCQGRGYGGGGRGELYTYRYTGSDESHFNFSLTVTDKVTRQCPQTTTFEEKGEPKQIRTEVPLLTSRNALPLGQTGSHSI